MRGRSKSLPKYRKHKPSGQAVVTLNGKQWLIGPVTGQNRPAKPSPHA